MRRTTMAAAAALMLSAAPAGAQGFFEEFRLNVLAHDVTLANEGSGGTESGVNIQGELTFATPAFLEWAWSPEPYVYFSANTEGDTNHGGFGLAWDFDVTERFFGEFGLGYTIHDGVTELNPDPANPDRIRLANTRVIFGSRDLFRTTFVAGFHLTERVDAALVFEHLSHGQILGDGKNEGLDSLGLRLSYSLAP